MYGPTETTIWSTISKLTHKNRIDIGRPISNTKIYIMDKDFSIVPNGQAGEICIAGKGLARGYVGRFDLTNEKFQYLPNDSNVRIYRTGDIGRYLPDNNLEYLGRMDNQVKIRGHRIELEEIEATINQYIGINQSVVTIKENSKTSKELQAFYTSDNPIDHNKLIQYLSSKLPQFMVPTIFKRVEGFVQMSNGKIDRKKVFECIEVCDQNSIRDKLDVEDLNDLQKKVIKIITLNLGSKLDGESLKTKLSTGLDSITFIKIVIALENEFNFEFDYEKLIIREFPTIMSMIEYLETKI